MGSRLLPKRLPNLRAPLATPRRMPLSRQKKTAILSWSPTFDRPQDDGFGLVGGHGLTGSGAWGRDVSPSAGRATGPRGNP